VWYDRRKLAGQPPEENPMFDLHTSRRIDFVLIVNARLGCVYVEFLTGTTDIDAMGRHNPGMREHMERRKDFELVRIRTRIRTRMTSLRSWALVLPGKPDVALHRCVILVLRPCQHGS
jgi:hypothetical protein